MVRADSTPSSKPAPDSAAGKVAFLQSCARCHGLTGAGDGRDAVRLFPRPRNLTEGVFKFRSPASGTPPTDDDLFTTVTHGLNAGGMPDWSQLDDATRWQLVAYVKSLSPAFTDAKPEPVNLGHDPGARHADPKQGRAVYDKLGCAACHGPNGRANGTSAPTLVDNWGRATRPANLTQGWSYRGGSDPASIVTRLVSGIDGSPMPSYAEAATTEELWQLAYYVRSLQQDPRWAVIARVPFVAGALPDSVDDPRWDQPARVDVQLRVAPNPSGEIDAPLTTAAVSVQALHDRDRISVKLSWFDATDDHAEAADAVAVAFRPVAVLGDVVTLQTWPLPARAEGTEAGGPSSPALDLCVWSATDQQVKEAAAGSYEPLLGRMLPQAATRPSHAVYEDGRWTLVMTRPLPVRTGREASSRFIPVAFAVWDGAIQPHRAVSSWLDLDLQDPVVQESSMKPSASTMLITIASAVVLIIGFGRIIRRKP